MYRDIQPALWLGDISVTGISELPSIQVLKEKLSFGKDQISLPDVRLDVSQSIAAGKIDDWNEVVNWLSGLMAPDQMLIVDHDHLLRDLAAIGAARGMFRYGLAFPQLPKKIFARDYEVIGSATFCLFPDAKSEADFRRMYAPPYVAVQAADGVTGIASAAAQSTKAVLPTKNSASIRVLVVAYFSGPARTVGVQRINYWHTVIPQLASDISVTIATAMPSSDADPSIRIITDSGPASLISEDGSIPDWAAAFIDSERRNAKCFSTLSYYWRIALEQYFSDTDDHYDVVIISGNPFSVFDFAAYAKRRWYARVILDYRDPFANNPRMAYTPEARDWARYIEKGYNLQADLITVVNDACAEMVEASEDVDVRVVPNGFDETVVTPALSPWHDEDGCVHFIHAGSFYAKCPPDNLIAALDPKHHRLHHVGNPLSADMLERSEAVALHGTQPYAMAMQTISRADCGIVFMSGDDFETPTKLYDYLAHGLDILVISAGRLRSGPVAEIVRDIGGVWWSDNTPESLGRFLAEYRPSSQRRCASLAEQFSRRHGAEILIDAIRSLVDQPSN